MMDSPYSKVVKNPTQQDLDFHYSQGWEVKEIVTAESNVYVWFTKGDVDKEDLIRIGKAIVEATTKMASSHSRSGIISDYLLISELDRIIRGISPA